MTIDFHAEKNELSYTGRTADNSWSETILSLVNPVGKNIVDIGSGGGIYSKAWAQLGAATVTGVDFSQVMVQAAKEHCADDPALSFVQGDARATGLPSHCADIVFARALIHHLPEQDLQAFFSEVIRLLAPGGICLIQDRTIEDVKKPASPTHFRGYFFTRFPRLLTVELARRPEDGAVQTAMKLAGLEQVDKSALWETRREYETWFDLEEDLLTRKGRSILHELTDDELADLVHTIRDHVTGQEKIKEQDCWSIWIGRATCGTIKGK
ncbi:class I SAM-dependent methyltransferase [Brevibacillus sp. 179-C9.3 HS]|uniref:class I SAM-dependent methyltransferase n=1 Tax=unclassified Brevibacillus TaxID=2684853 RepID=UPI0039A1B1C8